MLVLNMTPSGVVGCQDLMIMMDREDLSLLMDQDMNQLQCEWARSLCRSG